MISSRLASRKSKGLAAEKGWLHQICKSSDGSRCLLNAALLPPAPPTHPPFPFHSPIRPASPSTSRPARLGPSLAFSWWLSRRVSFWPSVIKTPKKFYQTEEEEHQQQQQQVEGGGGEEEEQKEEEKEETPPHVEPTVLDDDQQIEAILTDLEEFCKSVVEEHVTDEKSYVSMVLFLFSTYLRENSLGPSVYTEYVQDTLAPLVKGGPLPLNTLDPISHKNKHL